MGAGAGSVGAVTSDTSSPRTETGSGGASELGPRVADRVADLVLAHEPTARSLRRDLHAHPELARAEHHATARLAELLTAAGAEVKLLPGTGLIADLGPDAPRERTIAVRADLDALRTPESTGLPYASTVPGVAHACGHDVHTAAPSWWRAVLADLAARATCRTASGCCSSPPRRSCPGRASRRRRRGDRRRRRELRPALRPQPRRRHGRAQGRADHLGLGPRHGPAAGDRGHTSRPHLAVTWCSRSGRSSPSCPPVLARRVDPRAGVNLTWGAVHAGDAANAVPRRGFRRGHPALHGDRGLAPRG